MRKDHVAMNMKLKESPKPTFMQRVNEVGKRFTAMFIFCCVIGFGFQFVEWGWGKIKEWWFWMPAKLGSDFLEWVQDHPPAMALLICFVFAVIGTICSYVFREDK